MDEFDYLVIGDEPAGLWFLSRLYEHYRILEREHAEKHSGRPPEPPPRLGWVSFASPPRSVLMPAKIAEEFHLRPTKTWSPEVVIPGETFSWSEEEITQRFVHLPYHKLKENWLTPPSALCAQTLKNHPELIPIGKGMWKLLGRAERPSSDALVTAAVLATDLFWWDPAESLPEPVVRIPALVRDNLVESFEPARSRGHTIRLRNIGELTAKRILFNNSLFGLKTLLREVPKVQSALQLDPKLSARRALYPLKLAVEKSAIPCPVRPVTIAFDSLEMPDGDGEIWPFQLSEAENAKELCLWVSGRREISLDTVLEQCRKGFGRLNQIFPFLSRSLVEVKVPMSMDSCFSSAVRHQVMDYLEEHAIELYDLTSFQTHTRLGSVFLVGPFLSSHLPHPVGSLMAARQVLREVAGRRSITHLPGQPELVAR
jgi:hypothetical protein